MGSPEAFLRTVVTEGPQKGAFLFSSTDVALLRVDLPTCGRLRLQHRTFAYVGRDASHCYASS